MPLEILLGTRNAHKIREIKEIFSDLHIRYLTLDQFPNAPVIIEDGRTFEENAVKKATILARFTGKLSLSDDSGIEVDYLNGAPGIYSARFSGESASDEANNIKLMSLLKGVPEEKRTARYRCSIAVANPQRRIVTAEGICEGTITRQPSGNSGFGYDPIFYYPPFHKTFGDTQPEKKNLVSHRYQALLAIKPKLFELTKDP